MTVPDKPPHLVPGRSAVDLIWLGTRCSIIGGAFYFLIPLGAFLLPEQVRLLEMVSAGGVTIVFAIIGFVAFVRFWMASRREFLAGYTTLYARYYQYWQLDSKTGDVLRRPGEREVARRRS